MGWGFYLYIAFDIQKLFWATFMKDVTCEGES